MTCALIIASLVFFAGCAEKERTTPAQTEVFKEKTGLNVSTTNINVDIEGVNLSGFLVQPVTPGKYPGIVMIHEVGIERSSKEHG